MESANPPSQEAGASETNDLFEMANLFPRTTGLPMTVWVSPRGNACHDAIKVNMSHGNLMSPTNTAVVGVRPSPHMVCCLSAVDQRAGFGSNMLNSAAIIGGWESDIATVQLARALKPLP